MAEEIVERLKGFSLTPEEEDDIVIDATVRERAVVDCSTSLVGKLLTKRGFSRAALKDTMRKVWGSPEGLRMVDVGENLFHFRFVNEMDLQRVVNGDPWCFDNMLLLLRRWEAGLKADTVVFNEIDFWIQLWGLPFEYISPEIGGEIGRRIGTVLEVNKVIEKGDWGRYVRVRVRIPLNRPLRRGGNVVLGEGLKCWVDYKYERLPLFCHYCGLIDHEIQECSVKSKDVMEGYVKENSYGPWMAAASSFRRGYKWKERDQGNQRRWRGEAVNSGSLGTAVAAGDRVGDEIWDGQLRKDKVAMESRDSRLIEVGNDTVVAINGKQFRMGELIPDFSVNCSGTKTCDMVNSRPSLEGESGGITGVGVSLGQPFQEGQMHINNSLTVGMGSDGLRRDERAGPIFSFGSTKPLGNDVALGSTGPNNLMGGHVLDVPKVWHLEKSGRVLPSSLRGRSRGRKPGPISKKKVSISDVSKEDGEAGTCYQIVGKRRLETLDSDGLAKQAVDQRRCRFTGVYAPNSTQGRRVLWEELGHTANASDVDWLVGGDFNAILHADEKLGGTQRQEWELTDFQQFVQQSNLIDLGYVGYPFTWNNRRVGRDNVRVRLDRFLASPSWRIQYPNAAVNHLQPGGSDHCPLLLKSMVHVEKLKHRFIFYKRWGGNANCGSIIRQAWGVCIQGAKWFQIHQKIKACRFGLIQWWKQNQCNSRFNKDHLEVKLQQLFECTNFDQQEFWQTETLLKKALIDEEDYWRNKARVNWLKSGDRNAAFFHARFIQRRQQNRLMGLEDTSGRWCEGDQAVKEIAVGYFQNIFSSEGVTNVDTGPMGWVQDFYKNIGMLWVRVWLMLSGVIVILGIFSVV
ncbi:hypothetical protein Vadar_013209 [Vaccinium darrowii]|nr:hypothetical protein Vadar_013209 [Vaccinium darrowii]